MTLRMLLANTGGGGCAKAFQQTGHLQCLCKSSVVGTHAPLPQEQALMGWEPQLGGWATLPALQSDGNP